MHNKFTHQKFMHSKDTTHSSSLLLLELIFAIFFFMIACAVCVQLFVNSRLLSKDARYLSYGVNECASTAEIILAADSTQEMEALLKAAFPDLTVSAEAITIPFRENQDAPKSRNAQVSGKTAVARESYETVISYQVKDQILTAEICFQNASASETLYQLTIDHYLSEETHEQ